jgi:hypothetical protein
VGGCGGVDSDEARVGGEGAGQVEAPHQAPAPAWHAGWLVPCDSQVTQESARAREGASAFSPSLGSFSAFVLKIKNIWRFVSTSTSY